MRNLDFLPSLAWVRIIIQKSFHHPPLSTIKRNGILKYFDSIRPKEVCWKLKWFPPPPFFDLSLHNKTKKALLLATRFRRTKWHCDFVWFRATTDLAAKYGPIFLYWAAREDLPLLRSLTCSSCPLHTRAVNTGKVGHNLRRILAAEREACKPVSHFRERWRHCVF